MGWIRYSPPLNSWSRGGLNQAPSQKTDCVRNMDGKRLRYRDPIVGQSMAKNRNLHRAKANRTNEFYTQLLNIENELRHYTAHFAGKVSYPRVHRVR